MKKLVSKIACLIICILSSISLVRFIQIRTLLSTIQMIFLFAYFFVITTGAIFYITNKKYYKKDVKMFIYIVFVSIVVVILYKDRLIVSRYEDANLEIVAMGQKNEESNSYEVWILRIGQNGETINLESLDTGEEGWYYKDGSILSNKGTEQASLFLHFPKMENVKIMFGKHDWSGFVKVRYNGTEQLLDLYSANGGTIIEEFFGVETWVSMGNMIILLGGCLAIIMCLGFLWVLFYKKGIENGILIAVTNLMLLSAGIHGELYGFFARQTKLFLFFIVAISAYSFKKVISILEMKVYFSGKGKILLAIYDIYATFALVGHYLFFSTNKVTIDMKRIAIFLICAIVFYPVVFLIIYLFQSLKVLCNKENKVTAKMTWKIGIQSFCIMAVPLLIFSLGYYPGNMTSDGVDQWTQALGIIPIYNHHPAIHTIFLRLCSKIVANPYSVVIVHILLFSLIWARLFAYLYQKGLNKKVIYIVAFFLACVPNDFLMLSLISKNVIYAVIVLWVTYLLIRMLDEKEQFFTFGRILEFSIVLSLLYTVRKNGFLAVYAIDILLVFWAFYKRKQTKFRPILVVLLVYILINFIQGPLYRYYEVGGSNAVNISTKTSKLAISPLTNPIGTYILADEKLPEKVQAYAEQIGTIEEWKKGFNPYNGDVFDWGNLGTRRSKIDISFKEIFSNYLTLLFDKPLLVLKDRLTAVDLLWNVIEPTKSYVMSNVYNSRYAIGLWPPTSLVSALPDLLKDEIKLSNGSYFKGNKITEINNKIVSLSSLQIMDSVFWRGGIYVVIGLLIIVMYLLEKKAIKMITLIPVVSTALSLALSASWQIYQYYWFLFLGVIYCALFYVINVKQVFEEKQWDVEAISEKQII